MSACHRVAQACDGGADLGVGAGAGDHPALGAPADARTLVRAGKQRHRRTRLRPTQCRSRRHQPDGAIEKVHGCFPKMG